MAENSSINSGIEIGTEVSAVNPNPDYDRLPDPFEGRIEGFVMSRSQMEDALRDHISKALKEMGITMRDLILRGGDYTRQEQSTNGGKTKFLETVFEFDDLGRGVSEDDVARYMDKFHPFAIEGVKVTMKPVNDRQSGSIDDYWARFTAKREAAEAKREQEALQNALAVEYKEMEVPVAPPYLGDPDDPRTKDVMAKFYFDKSTDIAGGQPRDGWKLGEVRGIPFSRDEISQIAAAFGTTTELDKGGWILPDGRLLNFIRDGVRRDDKDIGIGFTEDRKETLAKYEKARRAGRSPEQLKDNGSVLNSPAERNGVAQSMFPPRPEETLAKNEFPELYPLEALKGGLIRYGISDKDNVIEIDAYSMPTQGQFDVLEDIHEWVKFVDDGGYDKKKDGGTSAAPEIKKDAEISVAQEPQSMPLPSGQTPVKDGLDSPDAFEEAKEEISYEVKPDVPTPPLPKDTVAGQTPSEEPEDEGNRLIIVYVGAGQDDWWDYQSVADLQANLVKDIRRYFREGKKPNEDFELPEEVVQMTIRESATGEDAAITKKTGDKRNYRPRTTLLRAVDYQTARRICRENVALIRTIPILDLMKAEQKMIAYFRGRITRGQLASYFYRAGNGAITRRHAGFIADDQINKATERMLVEKWRDEGITMVRWVHCGLDEPRPYHKEKWNGRSGIYDGRPNGLNGFVFPIDFPPVINKSTGERGYPGHLPNCRCHLEPIG